MLQNDYVSRAGAALSCPRARELGKGPYVTVECQPGGELVGELAKLVNQLARRCDGGNWSLDWSKFNTFSRQAEDEAPKGDHSQAVRDYARAMRAMMNELRNQRLRSAEVSKR